MIEVVRKQDCCGCTACKSVCPRQCITMEEDSEGFLYPIVDRSKCVDCHLCEKVCPMSNVRDERRPLSIYAFKHNSDEVRMRSSSGGMFSLLAEHVLSRGGVVFGAAFDEEWEVAHKYIESAEELDGLRRSKYVQSRMGESYSHVLNFLKAGRLVLFAGTPCQIAGLLRYVRKDYANLLTMDFVCHSVPSPKVWRKYLKEECARKGTAGKNSVFKSLKSVPLIKGINFRDKSVGWKKFSFSLSFL